MYKVQILKYSPYNWKRAQTWAETYTTQLYLQFALSVITFVWLVTAFHLLYVTGTYNQVSNMVLSLFATRFNTDTCCLQAKMYFI